MEQTLKQRQVLKRSILDPKFRYVPAAQSDIRKTFARVRQQQKKEQSA